METYKYSVTKFVCLFKSMQTIFEKYDANKGFIGAGASSMPQI